MKLMQMIIVFCIAIVLLVGCGDDEETIPEGYYTYDESEVNAALDELSFDPQLPRYLPMSVEFIITDTFSNESSDEALDISFYSRDNDLMTYQVYKGEIDESFEGEHVLLNEAIEATYRHNRFAHVMTWEHEGLTYHIEWRESSRQESGEDITKEDLIVIAESMYSST
ncbi:hypothetical protein SAMN05421734_1152 [Pelagirhabdus alkalitolerans]|uniref:DUF4367 domain-containing protein n=1 Tax=Pelagirhabdus alkalitolerans TaxID=1612202 RepID=A0A1G6N7W3_9BACI|nr:hypothetical protein [Pelagirhabdus alkalitolerans]SDC63919.1 hypothetical protein SAMN05421734_1152 [Pelagirhabdus alkalitolerans]